MSSSGDHNSGDDDDDDDISALFDGIENLALDNDEMAKSGNKNDETSTMTTGTTRSQQRKLKRRRKKGHSLEHLRQRISHLMSIFEENGWFIPLPEKSPSHASSQQTNKNNKKGKVWSNRNYGADKKRQRKQSEKEMLEDRIAQLENVLRDEYGMVDNQK